MAASFISKVARAKIVFVEIALVIAIFAVTCYLSANSQKQLTYHSGRGWDGQEYYSLAEQFALRLHPQPEGTKFEPIRAGAPYVYRIGTSFLAAFFYRDNVFLSFKIVNLTAALIATLLLLWYLHFYLRNWIVRVLLVGLFLTHWLSLVRITFFHELFTDNWAHVFLLLGLIGLYYAKQKPSLPLVLYLALVTGIGVMFREVVLIVAVALFFVGNPLDPKIRTSRDVLAKVRSIPLMFVLPLIAGIAGTVFVHSVVSQHNVYHYADTAINWIYDKPLITYIHGWFITFGPVIVLLIINWRNTGTFLLKNQVELIFVAGIAFLAWLGGTDTERLLYGSMPVVYMLIGKAMEERGRLFTMLMIVYLAIGQALSYRIFWPVPDFPNENLPSLILLAPIGTDFSYNDLFSFHARRNVAFVSFVQYVIFSAIFLIWWAYQARQQSTPTSETSAVANP
jgi:hypothetical protein